MKTDGEVSPLNVRSHRGILYMGEGFRGLEFQMAGGKKSRE